VGDAKHYVLTPKRGAAAPADWLVRLAAVPGVVVTHTAPTQAHIRATPAAAARVREQFSGDFHIEEVAPRSAQ
jgi:hypothetical protein